MVKELKFSKLEGFLLLMISLAAGWLFVTTIVLGKAGLLEPDVANQFSIYSDLLWFGLFIIFVWGFNFLWKRNDQYGDNIGIYNKEETIFKNFTYPQIALLSYIFFYGLFLVVNLAGRLGDGFFGLRVLPTQQFTRVDSLLTSLFQVPIPENFMAAFSIGLISLALTLIAVKRKWNVSEFKIYKMAAVIVGLAIFGAIWHLTAYPGQDEIVFIVAIFWGLGALISLLTGFFIPFLAMHQTNNFFIDFARLYSSDTVLFVTVTIFFGMVALYGYVYRGRLFPFRKNVNILGG